MRTIAETYFDVRAGLASAKTGRPTAAPDPLLLCDRTRDAYLAQRDLPAADAAFAPPLFASLRALVVPRPASPVLLKPALRTDTPAADFGPAPTITATLGVLTAV